jgi:hypothetical protein
MTSPGARHLIARCRAAKMPVPCTMLEPIPRSGRPISGSASIQSKTKALQIEAPDEQRQGCALKQSGTPDRGEGRGGQSRKRLCLASSEAQTQPGLERATAGQRRFRDLPAIAPERGGSTLCRRSHGISAAPNPLKSNCPACGAKFLSYTHLIRHRRRSWRYRLLGLIFTWAMWSRRS